jgi:hypothetical protein
MGNTTSYPLSDIINRSISVEHLNTLIRALSAAQRKSQPNKQRPDYDYGDLVRRGESGKIFKLSGQAFTRHKASIVKTRTITPTELMVGKVEDQSLDSELSPHSCGNLNGTKY